MRYISNEEQILAELRPMNQFPKIPEGKLSVSVLVFLTYTEIPIIVTITYQSKWGCHEETHGIGWLPLPKYHAL